MKPAITVKKALALVLIGMISLSLCIAVTGDGSPLSMVGAAIFASPFGILVGKYM